MADPNAKKKRAKTIRVVIIDDHPLIRTGLKRMIDGHDGFVVCGEAGNAIEAVSIIRAMEPDIAIIDVGLPGDDGITLTAKLVREFPELAVMVLSMHDEWEYAARAAEAGAMGYMVKDEAVAKIQTALRQIMSGRRYVSPSIADELSFAVAFAQRGTQTTPTRRPSKRAVEIADQLLKEKKQKS